MKLTTQALHSNKLACILTVKQSPFLLRLADLLTRQGVIVEFHQTLPDNYRLFSYFFIAINSPEKIFPQLAASHDQKILAIVSDIKSLDRIKLYVSDHATNNIKGICLNQNSASNTIITKSLWFLFSATSETVLDFTPALPASKAHKSYRFPTKRLRFDLSRRTIVKSVLVALFFMEVMFLIPFSIATIYLSNTISSLKKERVTDAKQQLVHGEPFVSATTISYGFARPLLSFFFLAVVPDRLIESLKDSYLLVGTTIKTSEQTKRLGHLILQQQKVASEVREAEQLTKKIRHNSIILFNTSANIIEKLDIPIPIVQTIRKELSDASEIFADAARLTPYLAELLGEDKPSKILVFFYNNMELRPGGGFLGSFALLTINKYTLKEFTVYDVYDADGQLTTHIEPPRPVKQYLRQPHWFLRDSNFSPDFAQNVQVARDFLSKELGLEKTDTVIGITTTGLSYLLSSYNSLYVADFNEQVTADNFYLKTQALIEHDYFPGSKRKKHFLSSVARAMLLSLEDVSYGSLARGLKRALDEKHLIIFSDNSSLQNVVEKSGWSGNLITPNCAGNNPSCTFVYLYPIDANVGVNKTNMYISRSIKLRSVLTKPGNISHTVSIVFHNSSPPKVWPGGSYQNYFQLYIPRNAVVTSVIKDGRKASGVDEYEAGSFRIIGVPITINPNSKGVLELSYKQNGSFTNGRYSYQIVVQKQIGLLHTDFGLEIRLPKNVSIIEQNFTSLAKEQTIIYNTPLLNDQIFLMELEKN